MGFLKGFIDFLLAFLGLIVSLPITLPLSLLIAVSYKESPFFSQLRPGKKSKKFRLVKFKTMNNRRDDSDTLLPYKDRLTPLGRFIRSLSLDELPHIYVLKGDMSLIVPKT